MQQARNQRELKFDSLLEWMFQHYGPDRGYPRLTLNLNDFDALKYGSRVIQFNGNVVDESVFVLVWRTFLTDWDVGQSGSGCTRACSNDCFVIQRELHPHRFL